MTVGLTMRCCDPTASRQPTVEAKKMGEPLFVKVNLNAGQIRNNTKKLLQQYGKNPADVFLQVEQ